MKNFFTAFLIFITSGLTFADYDWKNINYYHSDASSSYQDKSYYIISINKEGEGKLEYFKNGKVNIQNFNFSERQLNSLNNKILKSGVMELDSLDLIGDSEVVSDAVYSMTITLNKILYKEVVKDDVKTIKKRSKSPTINVPNNIKPEYKERVYDFYYTLEMMVPDYVWEKAMSE